MARVVRRSEWCAKPPKSTEPLIFPVRSIVIKHTETDKCTDIFDCSGVVRGLQQAALTKGLPDIPYNFLIGGDLNVYEGRGWDYKVIDRKLVVAYIARSSDADQTMDDMTEICHLFVKQNDNKMMRVFEENPSKDQK